MSFYRFNREKLLKNEWDKYYNKERKQKTTKYYAANQEVLRKNAINLSEKEKNKKRKFQRERYHMNTDLNERLKQYQRNYYALKKNCFYSIKDEETDIKIW